MTLEEVRTKYLSFFEKRGHTVIAAAPLVLENDPTTLFTSSGMQPLVPYLMGEPHPTGSVRLVDSQPSIRVQDIEEVGDNRHTTFFEMLGNWSLGDYFKAEQLPWIYEFLTSTEGLGLSPEKLLVSVFEGNDEVPKDTESIALWKEIFKSEADAVPGASGLVNGAKIYMYPAKKNWWSRSGTPEQMPVGEIGGPDTEVFFDFGPELQLHENSAFKNEPCHPNCDCGRFMEVGNSVFIQYKKDQSGKLSELPQKNVDFGGGLERLVAAVNNDPDVFAADVFSTVISSIEKMTNKTYSENSQSMRVIADHMRASIFLIANGVIPSNKAQGYVLRRLLRRAIVKARQLGADLVKKDLFYSVIDNFVEKYKATYFEDKKAIEITAVIETEIEKFSKTLEKGLKEVEKITAIDGKVAFDLYQTYGFPLELTMEIFQQKGQSIDEKQFRAAFEEHQNKSRTASAGVFKGGLMDHSAETTRLHTATHLLHAALRKVLGEHVGQKGSNITHERLRFDFTHGEKVTPEQINMVQTLINEQIEKDLPVSFTMMSLEDAKKAGALAFFTQKYEEQVKVYTVGDPSGEFFSKEVCGGPHVTHLAEVGHVTITKEEAAGAGIRRIYATVS